MLTTERLFLSGVILTPVSLYFLLLWHVGRSWTGSQSSHATLVAMRGFDVALFLLLNSLNSLRVLDGQICWVQGLQLARSVCVFLKKTVLMWKQMKQSVPQGQEKVAKISSRSPMMRMSARGSLAPSGRRRWCWPRRWMQSRGTAPRCPRGPW